ncbi:MAG: FAD-dependent oxidoreductase [Acidobacteria bacterium]|nr:MAG: FAD-dependent oxidoreductase [Acidobacteriota bacterium]
MALDFDMVVIGGGAAGLTAAGMSASLGAKTALVEESRLGGDCTWTGCVPSKALLKAAGIANNIRTANRYGLKASEPEFDFSTVMDKVHEIQNAVYEEADAPPVYQKMGITVIEGRAQFISPRQIEVLGRGGGRRQVASRYFVIATGGRPSIPPIEGLAETPYLTSETIFTISKLPARLIVLGAGPVGIEMAQAFRRLGSEIVVINTQDHILPRDDAELTGLLGEHLAAEGIRFLLGSTVEGTECAGTKIRAAFRRNSSPTPETVEGDVLLVAAGRRPNFDELGLEAAGVRVSRNGVTVDRHCRTSAENIFACGDVTGLFQFTHMSEHMAKVAVTNALLRVRTSVDAVNVPWCTFTDPELAHAGASEIELKNRKQRYAVYRFPFSKVDRAVTDRETAGVVKVLARKFDGRIYGASILGAHAGDMIGEFALAMRNKVSLRKMADTIHPYPTYALGNRRAADQWYVRKQSRMLVRLLKLVFRYHGQLPDTSDPNRIV